MKNRIINYKELYNFRKEINLQVEFSLWNFIYFYARNWNFLKLAIIYFIFNCNFKQQHAFYKNCNNFLRKFLNFIKPFQLKKAFFNYNFTFTTITIILPLRLLDYSKKEEKKKEIQR